jgi:hypothetical protein
VSSAFPTFVPAAAAAAAAAAAKPPLHCNLNMCIH